MKLNKLLKPYRIEAGKHFRLKDHDPAGTHGLKSEFKPQARDLLAKGVQDLARLQDILAAQDRWGLLLIFQAMDAAGKDGTIKHVMSGVNPQGVQVVSFKAPSSEELDHDFLWRTMKCLPERGRIGIFNRSYYEEVLVVRVHPELLQNQKLPPSLVTKEIWRERFADINAFERYLTRNGIVVLQVLPACFEEGAEAAVPGAARQAGQELEVLHRRPEGTPVLGHVQRAYEDMIRHTASEHAPWYVVPADNKWFTRLVVAAAVVDALEKMDLKYPKVGGEQKAALEKAKAQLVAE